MGSVTPKAASDVLVLLDRHGWTVEQAAPGHGLDTFTALGEPRGDGTRPRVEVLDEVDAFHVRARHPDGRRLAAVWSARCSVGKWSLAIAWRGRQDGEHAPKQLTTKSGNPSATALKAYITTPAAAAVVNEEEAA